MLIKKNIYQDHPESTDYEFVVSTDSAIEKDLIEKHLRLAEQEYRMHLRKQTKHIPEARVICAANGHYTTLSAMHKYITCDCARRVFYEAPDADVYSITCPVCDHKRIMLKGDR